MGEIERLRAFARSCIATARSMSLAVDAARLREMAADAFKQASSLEARGAGQQQQQEQRPKGDKEN
jgi:hypothetical protein